MGVNGDVGCRREAGPEGPAPPQPVDDLGVGATERPEFGAFGASQLLRDLSGSVRAREVLNREIDALEELCWQLGVNRYLLAGALDLSRSKLYRRHPGRARSCPGAPQALTCDAER